MSQAIVGAKDEGPAPTNEGEFYRAAELVGLLHNAAGGRHAGARAVHARGGYLAGTFTASPEAKSVSRALHFQGAPVPVTARFSYSGGDPLGRSNQVTAISTRFYLPNGTATDLIGITLPAFFAATPDIVLSLLEAFQLDPATGKPDPAKQSAFLATHPVTAGILAALEKQLASVSFAETSYRPLHAFRFINAAGVARWAKYHWEPEAGVSGQPLENLATLPADYLFAELKDRISRDLVVFRLELQMGHAGDPLDDISAVWSDDGNRLVVGRLELTRPISVDEIGDPVMMHDPTKVTDGIEVSPGDAIMSARRGVYLLSVAERTGGWQHKSTTLATLCPVARPAS